MAGVFAERVYRLLSGVPKGNLTTYSALAKAAGSPLAARAVGTLMRTNAHPETVPCYKVVLSDGRVGNYSGRGGVAGKIRKLESDGIRIENGKIADFESKLFRF
jgi:O-6-methylguanine DNA methyltransferase